MKTCISTFFSLLLVLYSISGRADQAQITTPTGPSSTLQITLETNSQGKPAAMIINAKGTKTNLTLGTLLQATAESWLHGPLPSPPIDQNSIAIIKIFKQGNDLAPYVQDKKGNIRPLDLGSLLAGSASDYPGCTPAQMNGKSLVVNLIFNTDPNGIVSTHYIGTEGDELFNLGTLVRDTTLILNRCQGHNID